MKQLYVLIILQVLLSPQFLSAQKKQANRWYFGMYAGLDFNSGAPQQIADGALNTAEGCSSIADTSGNLLFYTDGITVYNRTHGTMANSGDLMGDISSTQSALIVPKPGNPNLYYIFTTDADGGSDGFRYSIVDLTLNGGLGDVSTKNVLIKGSPTEKISGVGNADGTGVWVATHDWGTNDFYVYLLTDTGLNMVPVVSSVGAIHNSSSFQNTYGQMKFSPNGQKLALGIGYQGLFELFDFDYITGVVSHPVTFNTGYSSYGVEFSPDNSKLYTTTYNNTDDIYYLNQFDLAAGNDAAIIASKTLLSNADVLRQMQLGPDDKIYIAKFNLPYLSVINNPNGLGAASDFQDNALSLDSTFGGLISCGLGLPGFVQSYFQVKPKPTAGFTISDSTLCPGDCLNFVDLSLKDATEWQWTFQGATPATSTQQNPQFVCYLQAGFYNVRLVVRNSVGYDTLNINGYVHVNQQPPVSISVNGDTLSAYNAVSYQWSLNGTPIPNATDSVYIATVTGNYTLLVTDANGCTANSNPIVLTSVAATSSGPSFNVFPVPAGDHLNITFNNTPPGNLVLSIVNVLGETVLVQNAGNNKTITLNTAMLPKGYYVIKLNSQQHNNAVGFVKN